MKSYPVLNKALCPQDVLGSRRIAPRILNTSSLGGG